MYSVYAQHWQRDTEAAASARVYRVSRLRHDAAPAPGVSIFRHGRPVLTLTPDDARRIADGLHDAAERAERVPTTSIRKEHP